MDEVARAIPAEIALIKRRIFITLTYSTANPLAITPRT